MQQATPAAPFHEMKAAAQVQPVRPGAPASRQLGWEAEGIDDTDNEDGDEENDDEVDVEADAVFANLRRAKAEHKDLLRKERQAEAILAAAEAKEREAEAKEAEAKRTQDNIVLQASSRSLPYGNQHPHRHHYHHNGHAHRHMFKKDDFSPGSQDALLQMVQQGNRTKQRSST